MSNVDQPQRIADAYHAVTVKGAWYGPTVAELIEKTSSEMATQRPIPDGHSILEILQHLLLWNERIRNTSEGHPMPRWEAEREWAEPAIPWNELVAHWNRSRDLLEERIRNFPVEDLQKQTPGRTYPYEKMLDGIVQHAIYHSGQISMLLSLLTSRTR